VFGGCRRPIGREERGFLGDGRLRAGCQGMVDTAAVSHRKNLRRPPRAETEDAAERAAWASTSTDGLLPMLIGGIFSYLRLSPEKFASAMSAYWRLNNSRTSAGCARLRNLKSQACSITPDDLMCTTMLVRIARCQSSAADSSSCPALCRASTSYFVATYEDVDGRDICANARARRGSVVARYCTTSSLTLATPECTMPSARAAE
jgi:hypothetical protein